MGVGDDGNVLGVIAGTAWVIGAAVATTLPVASTIIVVNVTCCVDAVSLSTFVCTAPTADSARAVVVADGTIDTVATWVTHVRRLEYTFAGMCTLLVRNI